MKIIMHDEQRERERSLDIYEMLVGVSHVFQLHHLSSVIIDEEM